MLGTFYRDDIGATSIEYALIVSLISVAIIGALLLMQGEMGSVFQYISNQLDPVFVSGN